MRTKYFSFRNALEILSAPRYPGVLDELDWACKSVPLPLFASKSKKQVKLDVIQQVMNTFFEVLLESKGWVSEPQASDDSSQDLLRADFRKTVLAKPIENQIDLDTDSAQSLIPQIEVEFGNTASIYRDIYKFQLSYSMPMKTDVGVLVLAEKAIAVRIDSGVASYEKAVRELQVSRSVLTVPILVIGLFDDGNHWDLRETNESIEMWKSAKLSLKSARREQATILARSRGLLLSD